MWTGESTIAKKLKIKIKIIKKQIKSYDLEGLDSDLDSKKKYILKRSC